MLIFMLWHDMGEAAELLGGEALQAEVGQYRLVLEGDDSSPSGSGFTLSASKSSVV